ncbi:MAG: 3-deoxy-manno-octulosonate cytidylyltransferase [Saprospiraceae bacterium]|jgi:3-deoxy-D-manno-octulosonate cytidylyltransferase|nr:3-deoxy-manno-octulosonate cytidylyltransferase [Saprospiraceae bacterium]MCB0592070.1 3-deoxy-manno-octulosonate cytidylyltransferase [Saprospiraceae bacterium]MCO5283078.1 3-deoxy-manno-octulosonate cytidylyltransferase [Saprospiraceae bacterium]MCO6469791.1 3-deoxy-manno-octulosonate cytidylyltransferase [Saprospiraceae bacterium]HMY84902.1 3-deoxy-manno-octulosonate cytidylyltransferase [Saprospiraceae bacterium]
MIQESNENKIVALIPARLESSRFPGKLLKKLGHKSVILHVHDNMVATGLFDHVAVVCNHRDIYDDIIRGGGSAYMSKKEHENGTSRISEIALELDYPIVFNVQGDEPFVNESILQKLINIFKADKDKNIDIVSPMTILSNEQEIQNPNNVKVVTDNDRNAMYFSRSPIPYHRNQSAPRNCFKHIGIYGYRKEALEKIQKLPYSNLEDQELIECLRYLDYGMKIKMAETPSQGVSIDTPEDFEKAIEFYKILQSGIK